MHLPFHPSSKVMPPQGWHTPGSDTGVIPLVRITLSSHGWCPLTSLCPLESPVTTWAVVLDTNISLQFISWTWSGTSPHSEASKVRSLQGNCEYCPSAFSLPEPVGPPSPLLRKGAERAPQRAPGESSTFSCFRDEAWPWHGCCREQRLDTE